MQTHKHNHRARRYPSGYINLQIPQELADTTKELLSEIVIAKRKEREDKNGKASTAGKFFNWIKDNATAIITILTVLSAVGTAKQYIDQQIQSEKLQKQTLIAQLAGDISDKTKRNSATYALATLAGEDAIPLLTSELKQNALFETDPSYQNAISQSLISIGQPALSAILSINREEASIDSGYPGENGKKIISATQPVIIYFLTNNIEAFQDGQNILPNREILLEGIFIQKSNLAYADFSNVKFSHVWLTESALCRTNFENSSFANSYFNKLEMGDNNFDNATITNTSFYDSNLENSSFNKLAASKVDFSGAYLKSSSWIGARIQDSDFSSTDLSYAEFESATIINVDFQNMKSREINFDNATLTSSDFSYANLEDASFNGADLTGVKFFQDQNDIPYPLAEATDQNETNMTGAFVRDADFSNAKNIDKQTQIYLCAWGALNVPGGCAGIKKNDTSALRKPSGTGGGACF